MDRQELAHHLRPDSDRLTELSKRVQEVRKAILSQVEGKYAGATVNTQAQTMDRAWRLSSYLRDLLTRRRRPGAASRAQVRTDLAALMSVGRMGSWQLKYADADPSQERLAETVLKLEREVYRTKRPRQLAKRDVFLTHRRAHRPRALLTGLSPGCTGGPQGCRGTTPQRDPGPHRRDCHPAGRG